MLAVPPLIRGENGWFVRAGSDLLPDSTRAGKIVSSGGTLFWRAEGLLPLLKHNAAASWTCPSYRVKVNVSFVSWISLINNAALLPSYY